MQSSAEIAITTTNSPDVIVLDVDCADSPLSSITDSAGLTWHQRAEISTYNYDYEYYAIANQKLSSDIITATCSSPAYIQMTAIGISNANVTSPFDPNPSLPYAVPYDSSPMTGQISTTDKDDMLLFLGNIAGSPVTQMTVANGFTIVPDSYANSNPLQYQIVNNTESNLRLSSQFSTSLDWESISDAVVQAGSSSTENIPSYQNCSTEGDYGVNIPWATDNVLLQYDILQVNPAVLSNNGICWIRIGAYLNGTQATFVKSVLQHYPTSQFHYIVNLDPQMLMATYGENWTLADWNAYVTEIVDNQTYSGVHVWEIDNEVDRVLWCPQELSSNCYGYLYNGNPGNPALSYYNMLKDAYEIIKAHNSSDTVIAFGGLPAFVGGDYINSYYNTNNYTATPVYQFAQQVWSYGASQYCDAISVHLYTQTTFPNGTGVWYLMNEYPKDIDPTYGINVTSNKPVSAIMANVTESYEALTGKPIWFDEFGMPLSDPNYSTDNMQEASTYASEVVPFVSQFSFSKGAFVWDLFGTGQGDPSTWGILNGTTLQPNQEFSAYTALIK